MTGEVTLNGRVLPDRRGQAEAARRPAAGLTRCSCRSQRADLATSRVLDGPPSTWRYRCSHPETPRRTVVLSHPEGLRETALRSPGNHRVSCRYTDTGNRCQFRPERRSPPGKMEGGLMSTVLSSTDVTAARASARAPSATPRTWSVAPAGDQVALGPFYACMECFGPLEIGYDFPTVTREQIEAGPANIWRYQPLLPVPDRHRDEPQHRARLHPAAEGRQPRPPSSASTSCGSRTTRGNPTHSFKDRVVAVALSAARELGSQGLRLPLHRQPGQRRRRGRRPRRHPVRGVHPERPRAAQADHLRGLQREPGRGRGQLRRREQAGLRDRRRGGGLGVRQRQRPARTTPRAPRPSATRSPSSSAGGCPTRS